MSTITTQAKQLIIIDSHVTDWQSLVSNVNPDTAVLVLDPAHDGINQIAELVVNYSNLDAIHIISHGSAGSLSLGSSTLDSSNIDAYINQLAIIGNSLSTSGDILLYGCNVAEGGSGQQFIDQLSLLTGADIAASNDLTGNAALGGNWVLESSTGGIEASAINPGVQFANVLATNNPPIGNVSIIGTMIQYGTIQALNTFSDADGVGVVSYQWRANGIDIVGAINQTYTLTQAEVGKTITVIAHYIDGLGNAENVLGTAAGLVQNVNDDPTGTVVINGTATQGQTLTASNSLADLDGLGTITYQWKAGGVNIAGANNATYTLTQAEVGKAITVVASYTDLQGTFESVKSSATNPVLNVNDAPTGSVTVTGTATQGQTLTVTNNLADIDGLGTITYQWLANGVNINGAIGSSLTLTQAEVGKIITVVASYTDGQGTVESRTSTPTGAVVNINDAPVGTVNIVGSPTQGQTLSAINNLTDADGLGLITYQWQANGVDINGANNSSYILSQADVGKSITVVAHYTDGQNTAESVPSAATAPVANVNDLPTGAVSITGIAMQGQTLTVSNNLADIDGLGTISYQWQADGVNIGSATGASFALTQAEVGKAISVVASYTDGQGTLETKASAATGLVTNVNDAPVGTVTITGTAAEGQILTASNNLTDVDGLGVITYQWQAGGVDIANASGSSFTLTQAEVGKPITVVAKYIDGQNTHESVSSAPTGSVTNVNDLPTGTVTIAGTPAQGQRLTASNTLADIDGLGIISYQWKASGVNIAGATNATYVLTQAEVGKTITVSASYTDGQGTAESVNSSPTSAVLNVNDVPTGTVTISGVATQGQILTATNTLADLDGLGPITYQWHANGVDIGGATGSTFTLTQAEVGKVISVTASYTDLQGTAESKDSLATGAVANINDLPTGTVSITGIATQGQTLTASNNLNDIDGLGTIAYQWQANGININGATNSTYTLTQSEVGKTITVVGKYTDGQNTVESVPSAATSAVLNVNDAPTGTITISGTASQGQILTASNNLADIDGLGTIGYQWQANGVNIVGATTATFTLTQAEVGKIITVVASYTDGQGTAETKTSAATNAVLNVNDAPTGTVIIAGTPAQGQILTVSDTLADVDGLGAITYQWKANGVNISGATGTSLALTQAEVGKAITVSASYTDGQGTNESVVSAPTIAVTNVNDLPVGTVTITGTAEEGKVLTASNNLTDADGLGAITYQWQANNVDIVGATTDTYTLKQADVGKSITVVAHYTDGQNTAESVPSAATVPVANVNDLPTGAVSITGIAMQGQTLTVSNNLADIDGLGTISYQWQADGVNIGSATGASFALTQAEVGKAISVVASYTDGQGTLETKASAATGLVTNVNDAPVGTVTITGTAAEGQILTASNNLTDVDGLGVITYQWQAGGVDIANATGSSFTLTQAEVGKPITVVARYTDLFGAAEIVSSTATSAVSNINNLPGGAVTINGTPTQGLLLTASNTLTDVDGMGVISYQWKAGGVNIASATNATYTLTQAEVGKAISVTASYSDGQGTVESVSSVPTALVANVNDLPTGTVTITGTATQGQVLTASNTLADLDGLVPGNIVYQWQANSVNISGATGSSYTLTQAEVGKVIKVVANYTDGQGTAESVGSIATGAVANVNDLPTGTVNIAGIATQGQKLTASNTLADADGLGVITYQWQANGVKINGATGTTYTLTQADVGKAITVVARYTDGQNTAESVTSAATAPVLNVNDAPTGTVIITGVPTQGQTLTASNSLADVDGLGAISYQWLADGINITGASGSTFSLTQAEVGKIITVVASYTDGQGTVESKTSLATSAVANVNDAPVGTVTITGTATQGETLNASNNLTDVDGLGAIAYQWKANGVDIVGATTSAYTLTQSEVGKVITVVANYTDGQGSAESVVSTSTTAVVNVNDLPVGTVTITGTPTQGQTLTASNSLTDADGLGLITYQWQSNGVNIVGGTHSTYTLTQAEVDTDIVVVATYTDGQGTVESKISAATGIVANINDLPVGTVTITGTADQNQLLTVSNNLSDLDGLGTISYQWQAGGVNIGGATGTTYILTQAEVGKVITVVASYTDLQGTAESVSSLATSLVTNVNDTPVGTVTITGTAVQGQTLTASNNLTDADGLGPISYQWKANDVNINGATNSTYVLSQTEVGKTITVVASYTDGQHTAESVASVATVAVANINDVPGGTVTIAGTAKQGQLLTASNNLTDVDGLGAITYQWKAAGVNIVGATNATYVLTQTEVGKAITVVASYTDGQGTAESVSSVATGAVANVNDLPVGTVTIAGTATQGQLLTVSNNITDADGLGVIAYQWKANGVDIVGATATTFTLTQAEVGKAITVVANYTDGQGTAESVASTATSPVVNVNDLPVGTVTITGSAVQGQILTASNNLTDTDGLGVITYQWQANGVNIAGATKTTYTLSQNEVGKTITVIAKYTDGQNTAESVPSAATIAVANVNDLPTGIVTVTGTATQGQTLTVSNNLADVDGLGVITYQWQAGGVNIGGATSSTYTLTQAEVGKTITAVASYTDGQGTAESVASTPTTAVINVNDLPTGAVTITGTPTQGQTLTVSDTLADVDGLGSITYQWKANGVNINGATATNFILTQAEVGKTITAVASYTDGQGTAESVASTPTTAVANVNDLPVGTVTITGTVAQGQTLTASNNLTDADGLGVITYQWQANGVNIPGATNPTYVLSEIDVGKTFSVTANYVDGFGKAESVLSALTAPVANVNDAPVLTTPAAINYTDTPFVDTATLLPVTAKLLATDPDVGDILTFTIVGGVVSGAQSSLVGTYGTLTITNTATGDYTFTPDLPAIEALGAPASINFTVKVADSGSPSLSATKTLTVAIAQQGVTETNGNDSLLGTAGNDNIDGLAGNDTIDGGSGADTMTGGLGNDAFFVDNPGDVVIEKAGGGTDGVLTSLNDYTLAAEVESLGFLAGVIKGTGNNLNNFIVGNSSDNIIVGGAGADTMVGGLGNDTYDVDNVGDVVVENANEGFDIVNSSISYTLGANLEALTLTGTANINGFANNSTGHVLNGNIGDNSLVGGSASDIINADAGNDTLDGGVSDAYNPGVTDALNGGAGNDLFLVRGFYGAGVYNGGTDIDTIDFSQPDAYTDGRRIAEAAGVFVDLGAGNAFTYNIITNGFAWNNPNGQIAVSGIENITGTNQGDRLYGDNNANLINGGAGDDILYGSLGADTLVGGAGNDVYYVGYNGDVVDVVIEVAGGGTDGVWSDLANYSLADNVESLGLGSNGQNATGNALGNYILGNNLNNILTGGEGSDSLVGGLGKDTLDLTETTAVTDSVMIGAGDSLVTDYDVVKSFQLGTGANTVGVDKLDLPNTVIASNAAAVNGAVDALNLHSHSITNGIISFDDIDNFTAPLSLTSADVTNAYQYLQANLTDGTTVAFVTDSGTVNVSTYVFQDGGAVDTLVQLVGVDATSINNTGVGVGALWLV